MTAVFILINQLKVDPNPKENIRISLAFNVKYIN